MSVNLIVEIGEKPIPLDVLCREVPGEGEGHAHEETLKRWCRVGVRGIRLESLLCGMRRCTSREALGRFFSTLTRLVDEPTAAGSKAIATRTRREARREANAAIKYIDSR
jgi:hypothetical protein